MENVTQPVTAKNPLIKIAAIAGGVILLGLLVINFAPTSASQDPLTPPAQAEWEQQRAKTTTETQKLCEEWKELSAAKGIDSFNGLLKEESRIPEWEANTTVDCSKVEAPLDFTQELN